MLTAPTRADAGRAFDRFLAVYRPKYPKAADCLPKDRAALLAFYDFPAEHWPHLRTTNPIESTFATVRLRTDKTRGCVSRDSLLALVFMLVKSAERRALREVHEFTDSASSSVARTRFHVAAFDPRTARVPSHGDRQSILVPGAPTSAPHERA